MFQKSLALIGMGKWGKNLARNFHELGALHTICDVQSPCSQETGIHYSNDFQEVLTSKDIKQVAIAIPTVSHYAFAKEALLAGKDVFLEKPICLNSSEAEELVKLAEQQQCILMVGHLLHYHPHVQKLKSLIKEGALGSLQYISANRLNFSPLREEGVLWDFACHDVSIILSLLSGDLPLQIMSQGQDQRRDNVFDTIMMGLSFENKCRAHVFASWTHPFKEQKMVVVGSEAMVVFDDCKPLESKLQLHPLKEKIIGNYVPSSADDAQAVPVSFSEPLRNECTHFLECCKERKKPITDGNEALTVVRVLEQAQQGLITTAKPTSSL